MRIYYQGWLVMGKHIHEERIVGSLHSSEAATFHEFLSLMKKERELDIEILNNFPLYKLGEGQRWLWIEGSKVLIHTFQKIDNEKIDIIESLSNISIGSVSPNRQLTLTFTKDKLSVEGTYKFTYDYLELLFHMGKFSKYCLDNQMDDILINTVVSISKRAPDKELQYRLIQDQGDWYIRGFTSTKYRNYDNHLALYLTLYALHQSSLATNLWFRLDKAYLSDSEIVIMFDQINPVQIVGIGNLYFGITLTNNEIKEKTFTLECRFRLEDNEGNEFGAIPPEGVEPILTIRHDSSIEHVKRKLTNLHDLQVFRDRITNFVIDISSEPHLSEDRIYFIFKRILNSRNKFSPDTKQSFKALQGKKIITNSLHIIKAFNRLNELVTDVEEKIHLERIFYEVCMDIGGKKRR